MTFRHHLIEKTYRCGGRALTPCGGTGRDAGEEGESRAPHSLKSLAKSTTVSESILRPAICPESDRHETVEFLLN